jgi:hypothetical protein
MAAGTDSVTKWRGTTEAMSDRRAGSEGAGCRGCVKVEPR